MGEPTSVRWVITVVFAAVVVTSSLRLVSLGRCHRTAGLPRRHEDFGHVVMAVGMIAMVLSWTHFLPTAVWVTVFAVQAVFFGVLLLRGGGAAGDSWDETHHMVASLGMIYMVVAVSGASGAMANMPGMADMPGMTMSLAPLAAAFGVYFLIYAVWSGLRATRLMPAAVGVAPAGLPSVLTRPLLVHGCRALMGGGMAYLLLTG